MPRCSGRGISGTLEFQIASRVAWKYRFWIMRHGLDIKEFTLDLMPAAVAAAQDFDSALGSNKGVHVYRACKWLAIQMLQHQEARKRRRLPLPPRGTEPRASYDLELRETVRLAMAAMNPRDRLIVTGLMAGGSLREVCKRHRVTPERVRQLAGRAIRNARHALRKEAVRVGSTLDECWR